MSGIKRWSWRRHLGITHLGLGWFWFTYDRRDYVPRIGIRPDHTFILGFRVWLFQIRTGMPYFSERNGYNCPLISIPYGEYGLRVWVNWKLQRKV